MDSTNQKAENFFSTKKFDNFPCAHRQWSDDGHCKYVHGYSRSFYFEFAALALDQPRHFVVNFGDLKEIKRWLEDKFDHTCLINEDDPEIETFKELHKKGIVDLRVLPNVSMEATSKYVFEHVNKYLYSRTNGRAWCYHVETRENNKNSGMYGSDLWKAKNPYKPAALDLRQFQEVDPKTFATFVQDVNSNWCTSVGFMCDETNHPVKKYKYNTIAYDSAQTALAQHDYRFRRYVDMESLQLITLPLES